MIGEVQYGGRVTDDYDKHLLITYAKVWFGEGMFADSFQFYTGKLNNRLVFSIYLGRQKKEIL
jgi:dynein heavy chain